MDHDAPMSEGRSLFEELVIDQGMSFLARHGFSLEQSRPDIVRFVSPVGFVEVFYDHRSLEVGVDIGLQRSALSPAEEDSLGATTIGRRIRPNAVSLDEVLKYRCEAADKASLWGSFSFVTPESLSDGLPRLLRALERCGMPFLRGERAAFEDVREASVRDGRALMARMRIEDLRATAERAWQAKDYATVAHALDSLGDTRTPAEQAKLRYARRRAEEK
jgi:hypothetical protein